MTPTIDQTSEHPSSQEHHRQGEPGAGPSTCLLPVSTPVGRASPPQLAKSPMKPDHQSNATSADVCYSQQIDGSEMRVGARSCSGSRLNRFVIAWQINPQWQFEPERCEVQRKWKCASLRNPMVSTRRRPGAPAFSNVTAKGFEAMAPPASTGQGWLVRASCSPYAAKFGAGPRKR